ncbi:ATP-binding protein [Myceligenerans crystallogenes]|uniref:ATP-binding protein n=1 Tax=Myceligenerans crystallogenes TaxID=316335 RepID=A0ABP4ZE70_9MICO
MSYAHLTELRLTAFKSFRDQVLPIDPTTILIGRNGSGKSNVLDALDVMARLVRGGTLAEALRPIRGGASGCAPHGSDSFQLGCTVDSSEGQFRYDVGIRIRPRVEIISERIAVTSGGDEWRNVIDIHAADGIEILSIKDEPEQHVPAGRLSTGPIVNVRARSQFPSGKMGGDAAQVVIAEALRSVFHLEPTPYSMREYVAADSFALERGAANISATLARFENSGDGRRLERLRSLVDVVSDLEIQKLALIRTSVNDVMLSVSEQVGPRVEDSTARELSDGILRLAAVGSALVAQRDELDLLEPLVDKPTTTLVMEEIDNGLHPAQAERVLDLVRRTTAELGNRIVLTTHNPAFLDAATGEINSSVIVCYRDRETGRSMLSRVTDLPTYARDMTVGGIGEAVTRGKLSGDPEPPQDYTEFFDFMRSAE